MKLKYFLAYSASVFATFVAILNVGTVINPASTAFIHEPEVPQELRR